MNDFADLQHMFTYVGDCNILQFISTFPKACYQIFL
jgi:hypothetical protein